MFPNKTDVTVEMNDTVEVSFLTLLENRVTSQELDILFNEGTFSNISYNKYNIASLYNENQDFNHPLLQLTAKHFGTDQHSLIKITIANNEEAENVIGIRIHYRAQNTESQSERSTPSNLSIHVKLKKNITQSSDSPPKAPDNETLELADTIASLLLSKNNASAIAAKVSEIIEPTIMKQIEQNNSGQLKIVIGLEGLQTGLMVLVLIATLWCLARYKRSPELIHPTRVLPQVPYANFPATVKYPPEIVTVNDKILAHVPLTNDTESNKEEDQQSDCSSITQH